MATVFDLLDREWIRSYRDRPIAHRLPEASAAAGGAGTLAGLEQYVRGARPADSDRVLLALATGAVDGDALAARVLLQLLLPGARRLARQWWALGDHDERAAAAVTAVYHQIRQYPLARRPGRVAANVVMDAARELRRSVGRVVAVPDERMPQRVATADTDRGAAEELADVLANAVGDGVIGAADAELIARTRIADTPVPDIAARRGLRPRTLWDQRHRAERALADSYTDRVANG